MTIVKSAGPMFALLWAFGLGLEPLSIKLVAIVIVISGKGPRAAFILLTFGSLLRWGSISRGQL